MLWSDDGEEVGRLLCFCGGGGRDASPASVVEEDAAWWTEEVAGRTIKSAPGAIMVLICYWVVVLRAPLQQQFLWQVVLRANQRAVIVRRLVDRGGSFDPGMIAEQNGSVVECNPT
mmetsp:Transcript_33878/g.68979  ORF Transcript_33878/g.68979 Transcript_33878/m.68979 type:complete len:116 (-) Transcript_33878:112-459(-)